MAGRRPKDRKQQILTAASELFRERGYHNVSVSDVTRRVDITPSALYRHFKNKNALLHASVLNGLDVLVATVNGADDLEGALTALTATMGDRRGLPLLWQREARYLTAEQRAEQRREFRTAADRLTELLDRRRPGTPPEDLDLLVLSLLAALSSTSAHPSQLPRRRLEELMLALLLRIADTPSAVSPPVDPLPAPVITIPMSRREQILVEATRLFDERGYQNVLTEDIGEACGTTGPNVYNHFAAKVDLLTTAVTRAFDRRTMAVRDAVAGVSDPEAALAALLRAHTAFAVGNPHLVGIMSTELGELPDLQRRVCAQEQRDYLHIWNTALTEVRPGLERHEAHLLISAVLTVVGNAARSPRLLRRPDLTDRLVDIGMRVLLSPAGVAATG